jgi:hypothetical protein
VTLRALLVPAALERLDSGEWRFCATGECEVVYFGHEQRFRPDDVTVPVFQKEPAGHRLVCYCLGLTEDDAEIGGAGVRIRALVKSGRCACELRNPQGRCCLGNLASVRRTCR